MCDRIMLMFGLGKVCVDKAMELKLQFAPLTKYQMDLVENREKYEESCAPWKRSITAGPSEENRKRRMSISIPRMRKKQI